MKQIKKLPATAVVTLDELNRLRRKTNTLWRKAERAEKAPLEEMTSETLEHSDAAMDEWFEAHKKFSEALSGRPFAKPSLTPPAYLTHDPGDLQLRENV